MAITTCTNRRRHSLLPKHGLGVALLALSAVVSSQETPTNYDFDAEVDYGNHNNAWEDGPSSWQEFGHDNDPNVCGLPVLTVEEWEAGKYWEGNKPVIVKNVTDGWAANHNWKLQEILRRYPDAEATMGEAKLVGETGPDDAGNTLSPTTIKEFITKHMYNPLKYFFDRKIAIPKGMLEDCHPFPMPTRAFLENPNSGKTYGLSKKAHVRKHYDEEIWRDHLAISIGADLQGLTFHSHGEAWNTVVFGKKRWILWDPTRKENSVERQQRLVRDFTTDDPDHLNGYEWIRTLYPNSERFQEIRNHGHDCIQHAGQLMFVPRDWLHMVVNIGDTVSVISEVGHGIGEGKKPEEFLHDPIDYHAMVVEEEEEEERRHREEEERRYREEEERRYREEEERRYREEEERHYLRERDGYYPEEGEWDSGDYYDSEDWDDSEDWSEDEGDGEGWYGYANTE
eukprot:CAMPEP_0183703902 /NCGR_PEP_ID=MMETSP0737-20130205/1453_1 /TAXON_ID=385413 /ORGANISM="Thalassiosira miniscula, Strain CCMP1093" /LENGTH=453 /DNA_ID=CAMNT_0025930705 /DNA_START=18 /DNA_END=1379 /DNA_ORIENTATION=-